MVGQIHHSNLLFKSEILVFFFFFFVKTRYLTLELINLKDQYHHPLTDMNLSNIKIVDT